MFRRDDNSRSSVFRWTVLSWETQHDTGGLVEHRRGMEASNGLAQTLDSLTPEAGATSRPPTQTPGRERLPCSWVSASTFPLLYIKPGPPRVRLIGLPRPARGNLRGPMNFRGRRAYHAYIAILCKCNLYLFISLCQEPAIYSLLPSFMVVFRNRSRICHYPRRLCRSGFTSFFFFLSWLCKT